VLWHYKDPRLQSQQQVQETADKSFTYLSVYLPAEKKFLRLADEALRLVTMTAEQKYAVEGVSRMFTSSIPRPASAVWR
jgi:hypothetical protein